MTLNDWLVQRSVRNDRSGASRTFVSIEHASGRIAGYYCLAAGALDAAVAPTRLRRNMPSPVPVVILGRLAVDLEFHRRGLGGALLRDALARCSLAARSIGARAIVVHPLDASAANFYTRFRFEPVDARSSDTMYLLLHDVEHSLGSLRQR